MEFDTNVISSPGLRQIFSARDPGSGMMFEFIERHGRRLLGRERQEPVRAAGEEGRLLGAAGMDGRLESRHGHRAQELLRRPAAGGDELPQRGGPALSAGRSPSLRAAPRSATSTSSGAWRRRRASSSTAPAAPAGLPGRSGTTWGSTTRPTASSTTWSPGSSSSTKGSASVRSRSCHPRLPGGDGHPPDGPVRSGPRRAAGQRSHLHRHHRPRRASWASSCCRSPPGRTGSTRAAVRARPSPTVRPLRQAAAGPLRHPRLQQPPRHPMPLAARRALLDLARERGGAALRGQPLRHVLLRRRRRCPPCKVAGRARDRGLPGELLEDPLSRASASAT